MISLLTSYWSMMYRLTSYVLQLGSYLQTHLSQSLKVSVYSICIIAIISTWSLFLCVCVLKRVFTWSTGNLKLKKPRGSIIVALLWLANLSDVPAGIYWEKLSPEKLRQIRILRQLKRKIEQETGQKLPTGPSEKLPPTAQRQRWYIYLSFKYMKLIRK